MKLEELIKYEMKQLDESLGGIGRKFMKDDVRGRLKILKNKAASKVKKIMDKYNLKKEDDINKISDDDLTQLNNELKNIPEIKANESIDITEFKVSDKSGKMIEPTAKHLKLFKQMKKDMGKKKINQKNIEAMLKEIGMPTNHAVTMATDFMNWHEEKK